MLLGGSVALTGTVDVVTRLGVRTFQYEMSTLVTRVVVSSVFCKEPVKINATAEGHGATTRRAAPTAHTGSPDVNEIGVVVYGRDRVVEVQQGARTGHGEGAPNGRRPQQEDMCVCVQR